MFYGVVRFSQFNRFLVTGLNDQDERSWAQWDATCRLKYGRKLACYTAVSVALDSCAEEDHEPLYCCFGLEPRKQKERCLSASFVSLRV